jgi:hypothetical protein
VLYEKEIKGLLQSVVGLAGDINREAMRLADACGRMGHDFKELYEQLAGK